MKKCIGSNLAPPAIGNYSQACGFGNFVFISGQLGVSQKTYELAESIEEQTKNAIFNLQSIAEAAGSRFDNIVKVTIFLKDINDFAKVDEIFGQFFNANPPARECVAVSNIPKNAKIEISAIAFVSSGF